MPLSKQQVNMPFGSGVDTKTDPKQVSPPNLILLNNGTFISPKKITKRNGFSALTPTLAAGSSLDTFQNQLIAGDGASLYSYAPSISALKKSGSLPTAEILTQIISIAAPSLSPEVAIEWFDCAVNGNLLCFTFTGTNSTYVVIDATTGAVVVPPTALGGSTGRAIPRSVGNSFVIMVSGTGGVSYYTCSTSTPGTLVGPTSLASATSISTIYSSSINSRVYMYWISNGGLGQIAYLDATLTLSSIATAHAVPQFSNGSIVGDASNNIWLFLPNRSSNIVTYQIFNANLSSTILANTTIDTPTSPTRAIGVISGSVATVYYETPGTDSTLTIKSCTASLTGTIGTPAVFVRGLSIASQPFVNSGTTYFWTIRNLGGGIQNGLFLYDTSKNIIGTAAIGTFQTANAFFQASACVQVPSGDFVVPYGQITEVAANSGSTQFVTNSALAYASVGFSVPSISVVGGENKLFSGALPSLFDGATCVEQGFLLYPETVTAVQGTGGSIGPGTLSSATWEYVATYQWRDAQGQVHQSAPSLPLQISISNTISFTGSTTSGSETVGVSSISGLAIGQVVSGTGIPSGSYIVGVGTTSIQISQPATATGSGISMSTKDGGSATVTIPTLRQTAKSQAWISVWRTVANGTVFFRVTSLNSPLLNDPTVDTLTFTDTASDISIIGNDQLYTTGGVLPNSPCPPTAAIASYRDRILAIPSQDPLTLWISQEIVETVPVEFSSQNTLRLNEDDGPATALAEMDDKLIIFKANTLWYTAGNGPTANGNGSDYAIPQKIPSDTGCITPRSVVLTPVGLMYQSNNGIYLLSRNLSVTYIGAQVEAYNSYTVTSARLVPGTNQVRFTISNGTALVFDYFVNQWSVFQNVNAACACIFENKYTYIQPSGTLMQETPGTFTDNGAFIPISLTTAWMSFSNLQGYQRVWRMMILGNYYSPHSLTYGIAINFDPTIVQTNTISVLSSIAPYQFRVPIQHQRCQSIQITLTETQSSSFGEGLSLSGLAFECGIKKGLNKIPAAQTYG